MHALARRRRGIDFWPGFVDALSALLMVLVFLLLVFAIGQFVLSDAISGRDRALAGLNAELAELARVLSLEQDARRAADAQVTELSASLGQTRDQRDALQLALAGTERALAEAQATLDTRNAELATLSTDIALLRQLKAELEAEVAARGAALSDSEQKLAVQTELSAKAAAQAELLNRQIAAIREQLAQVSAALELANEENRQADIRIEELGRELNLALASKVNQLARYRSEFFGRLRAILGNRSDIRIVGDRFVVPSELLFPSASDQISPEGYAQLDRLAATLKQVTAQIPDDLDWVLRIDGHTDRRPISTARFPSNWELSTARAIAMVKYLIAQGIPAEHLSANGFGEHQPLDPRDTPEAWAANRRIEIQLTNR